MRTIDQGTPDWFAVRLGTVTSSRVADVVARTKTGYGASRANYLAQLLAERLTGCVAESFTNAAMQWGTTHEPQARFGYEFRTNLVVETVGFFPHPSIDRAGASPDGLVGHEGLVEIKCPNTATHIETLRGGSVPGKYETQMQWQMACTGRLWCDFVSYDPRMPETLALFVQRVRRDDARILELEQEVRDFLGELDGALDDLAALTAGQLGHDHLQQVATAGHISAMEGQHAAV